MLEACNNIIRRAGTTGINLARVVVMVTCTRWAMQEVVAVEDEWTEDRRISTGKT